MEVILPERRPGAAVPAFSNRILRCLKAPGAGDDTDIETVAEGLRCVQTGEVFPYLDGVPSLFRCGPEEGAAVTSRVRAFYEEHPLPNYEGMEEFGELVNKGSRTPFSADLLKAIGVNKTVLECGCGTGQLSHFMQLNNNQVLGIDMSIPSLALALDHKLSNQLRRSNFCQMNIFDLAIKDNSFDVVISQDVLHHTFDARRAFAHIARKAKPGGIIVLGLSNWYARAPIWVRSKLAGILGQNTDRAVRNRSRDAYATWHTIDHVLEWFDENDIEYLNCSPAILGTSGETAEGMFDATDPGTKYHRIVTQLGWLGTIASDGALFSVIGRRKA